MAFKFPLFTADCNFLKLCYSNLQSFIFPFGFWSEYENTRRYAAAYAVAPNVYYRYFRVPKYVCFMLDMEDDLLI